MRREEAELHLGAARLSGELVADVPEDVERRTVDRQALAELEQPLVVEVECWRPVSVRQGRLRSTLTVNGE